MVTHDYEIAHAEKLIRFKKNHTEKNTWNDKLDRKVMKKITSLILNKKGKNKRSFKSDFYKK